MLLTTFHFCANLSCLLSSASCGSCSSQLPPEGGATAATVLLKSRNQVSGVADELFNPVIIICSDPCLKKPDAGFFQIISVAFCSACCQIAPKKGGPLRGASLCGAVGASEVMIMSCCCLKHVSTALNFSISDFYFSLLCDELFDKP